MSQRILGRWRAQLGLKYRSRQTLVGAVLLIGTTVCFILAVPNVADKTVVTEVDIPPARIISPRSILHISRTIATWTTGNTEQDKPNSGKAHSPNDAEHADRTVSTELIGDTDSQQEDCGGFTRVGFLVAALGHHKGDISRFLAALRQHFCTDDPCIKPTIYLFTSRTQINEKDVHVIPIQDLKEPEASTSLFEAYAQALPLYRDTDYMVHIHADLVFDKSACRNILDTRVATAIPWYSTRPKEEWPLESDIRSTAYVDRSRAVAYYSGGLIGAETSEFIRIIGTLGRNMRVDSMNNIKAIRTDASHWNAYLVENPPTHVVSDLFLHT